jgi:hypothetical protein
MNRLSSFVLPLPDPGELRSSKEIAFFGTVECSVEAGLFCEELCKLSEQSTRKSIYEFRRCCTHNHFSESAFLSLLQFLQKAQPLEGETVIVLGGQWKSSQFWLLKELYPTIQFDLWRCELTDREELPPQCRTRYGFPRSQSYSNETIHFFSNFRSEKTGGLMDDLHIQIKLVQSLGPKTVSVRFRPPLHKDCYTDSIEYLSGEMQTICYESPSSTATRIFARNENGFKLTKYNLLHFEEIMNHYNTELRTTTHWVYNGVENSFDNCYRNLILNDLLGKNCHHKEVRKLWERIVFVCRSPIPKL